MQSTPIMSPKFSRPTISYTDMVVPPFLTPTSIMVRMLVADDAAELFRTIVLQRGLARQVGDGDHPAQPGLGAILLGRPQPVRPVERAGHDLDARAADAAEAERGAAIGAEIPLGDRGGAERGRGAAGPGEI